MTDLPNGFTGFSHRDPNFVSAGDALRGSRYDDTPFAARKQAQARNLAEAWSPAASERAGAGVAAEGGSDAAARGASRSLSQLSSAASDVLRFAEQAPRPPVPRASTRTSSPASPRPIGAGPGWRST